MGNYNNLEHDFIQRTLALIAQYEARVNEYPFEQQYNYTLLLNCLLGIIVLPKERVYTHIPNPRITQELKQEMGLVDSHIAPNYTHLRDLIHAMRNSIAHFSIEIISDDDNRLVDHIAFRRPQDSGGDIIVQFRSAELLPFIRYYADWTRSNLLANHR